MNLDIRGYYVDIRTGMDKHKTFTSSAALAKYVYNNEGPHVVYGGNSVKAKQEAAAIVKNVYTFSIKHGAPKNENEWYDLATFAARL